jgi:beta-mannosidase
MSSRIVSEAVHLPQRRADVRHDLGLTVRAERTADGWQLIIEEKRFARFVHIIDAHYRAAHDWFHPPQNRLCTVSFLPVEKIVAHASNALFNADATYEAPAGEVRAINAISATFYG